MPRPESEGTLWYKAARWLILGLILLQWSEGYGEAKPLPVPAAGESGGNPASKAAEAGDKREPAPPTHDPTSIGIPGTLPPTPTEPLPWSFSYSTPDWLPSITVPSYMIPTTPPTNPFDTYSWYPSYTYSIPDFSVPAYSYSIPDFSAPVYSFPTAEAGDGSKKQMEPTMPDMSEVGRAAKMSLKKIIGAVVGSVVGFFSFLGGLWAACKRKMRRKKRNGADDAEKIALHGRTHSVGTVGSIPTLGYHQSYVPYDQVPLMHVAYPMQAPQVSAYTPTAF